MCVVKIRLFSNACYKMSWSILFVYCDIFAMTNDQMKLFQYDVSPQITDGSSQLLTIKAGFVIQKKKFKLWPRKQEKHNLQEIQLQNHKIQCFLSSISQYPVWAILREDSPRAEKEGGRGNYGVGRGRCMGGEIVTG